MPDYLGATELTLILPAQVSIGTNTKPWTLGEVASTIVEIEAELNAAVAQAGYDVPVPTGATYAYQLMQAKTKEGAACRVLNVLFPNMGGTGSKVTLASDYCKAYREFVKALAGGKIALVDAPAAAGEGARELPRSFEVTENVAPSPMLPIGYAF